MATETPSRSTTHQPLEPGSISRIVSKVNEHLRDHDAVDRAGEGETNEDCAHCRVYRRLEGCPCCCRSRRGGRHRRVQGRGKGTAGVEKDESNLTKGASISPT